MALQQEWIALQQHHQQYELLAVLIKLISVILVACAVFIGKAQIAATLLVCVLWLQEAIVRTWQSRLAERLLLVEAGIRADTECMPLQLHSQWQNQRPGGLALIRGYLLQAIKPTVAYPFIVLLGVLWLTT